ncbi:MAG: hypothetical protein HYX72_01590 [Acidobacteria bacterium]|nr:hypothetical protein [Acidobacteriota bacterium]
MVPGIGAQIGPYLQKGEWQVIGGINRWETDDQFRGTDHRVDLYQTDSQVKEGALTLGVQGSYGLTRQINLLVEAPIILSSYWSTKVAGIRQKQVARGLSDIVAGGRVWLFGCDSHPDQNIALGSGVRLPTGESNYQVLYPNSQGRDFAKRPVFPGIHPGIGAWGLRLSVDSFKQFRYFAVFGSGQYMFSLRDQNDTLYMGAAMNPLGPEAVAENVRYVSTPDSYLFSAGAATSVPKLPGVSAFFVGRIAGVPVHNVLTQTIGFRQPGWFFTIEPGLNFATKLASYNVSVPIRVRQNVQPDFLGIPKNSDFAHLQVRVGVMFQLGGRKKVEPDLGITTSEPSK